MNGYLWRGKPGLAELNAAIVAARGGTPPVNLSMFEWGGGFCAGNTRLRNKPKPAAPPPSATMDACSSPSPKLSRCCTPPSPNGG